MKCYQQSVVHLCSNPRGSVLPYSSTWYCYRLIIESPYATRMQALPMKHSTTREFRAEVEATCAFLCHRLSTGFVADDWVDVNAELVLSVVPLFDVQVNNLQVVELEVHLDWCRLESRLDLAPNSCGPSQVVVEGYFGAIVIRVIELDFGDKLPRPLNTQCSRVTSSNF